MQGTHTPSSRRGLTNERASPHHLHRRPRGGAARPLDLAAAREVRRQGTARRARPGEVRHVGRGVLVQQGRARRRLVRLLDLRRPDLPVPAAVGRDRVPRPRQHAGHLRRDPSRLLEAPRATPGHGRQLDGRVDLLPERAAAVRGPGVLRARRQGPRAPVRAGLQRLDDRRVVRRRGARPAHPAHDRAALGRRRSRPPRSSAARRRAASRSRSPRTRTRSACRRSTTRTASGTRSSPRSRRPRPRCACTSGRRRRCRARRPTRRSS